MAPFRSVGNTFRRRARNIASGRDRSHNPTHCQAAQPPADRRGTALGYTAQHKYPAITKKNRLDDFKWLD